MALTGHLHCPKDHQLQGTELSPQVGRGSSVGHMPPILQPSSTSAESAILRHKTLNLPIADISNKNPYLFKSTLCTSIFIWGFQIAFWGVRHDSFHFTWLCQGLNQKPWLPYTFPSSVLLHREIHVGENFSWMRMLRMNTQNPFSAFSLLKLDSFSRTSINTVQWCQLNLVWKCTLSFLPCHGCLIK